MRFGIIINGIKMDRVHGLYELKDTVDHGLIVLLIIEFKWI